MTYSFIRWFNGLFQLLNIYLTYLDQKIIMQNNFISAKPLLKSVSDIFTEIYHIISVFDNMAADPTGAEAIFPCGKCLSRHK